MQANTVTIDTVDSIDSAGSSASIQFAPRFNVAVAFIDRHLEEGRAHKAAIRTVHGDVTYGQLAENVNRCGNALRSLGVESGNRLLMIVKDCPEFFFLFWGAIKAGIVPVPVNTLLRAADYQYMIDDSDCALVVYSSEYAQSVESALAEAERKPQSLCVAGEGRMAGGGSSLAARMQAVSAELEPAPATAEDDCFWLYSSGSTGRPKGAVHRQRDMVVTCVQYARGVLGMTEDDVCFSAAKLFFAYGLGNAMTFPLWCGASAVLSDQRPSPDMTFALIERFQPTLYFGVPTLYAAQLLALEQEEEQKQKPREFPSLRACVSAGEALPAEVFRRWKEYTGLTILDGIGSTELLHIFISNRPDDYKPGTSGRPVPGYEAKIVDESGNPVAVGDMGRLLIQGQSGAAYYWNNPEKTAQTMLGDWINTGDTYVQDEDGYFAYCGRADDMLKVSGQWVSPAEVESILFQHPAVLEAAIVGWEDDNSLTKPKAFVVLKEGRPASEDLAQELSAFVKDRTLPHKYPRWVEFVSELPKTATGKIQRYKLRTPSFGFPFSRE